MADTKVQKCVVDFFTQLNTSYKSCKNILIQCHNITYKIHSLVERHNKINRASLTSTPFDNFPDIRERLNFAIFKEININCKEIQIRCELLQKDYETLHKKMINLENICSDLDFKQKCPLIDGSCFQPNLSYLLEYSIDGTRILHDVWSQVKFSLQQISINCNQCDFLQLLSTAYRIDKLSENRMNHILEMTQFCNKTEL